MNQFPPITDEDLQAAVAALRANGNNKAYAAHSIGMALSTYKDRLKMAGRRGLLGYEPVVEGFEIKKISTQQDDAGTVTKTFVQQVPEREGVFELPEGHVIKGVSAYLDADGKVIGKWIKTKTDTIVPAMIEALKLVFAETDKATLANPPEHTNSELCSVYPIADQHNGMVAWGKETGESYDLKIGAARLRDCMTRLVSQSPNSRLGIILNLGDWQHTDDNKNMTPGHGNILDVDSRYFKILSAGVRLMKDCVDLALQKHEHVIVANIPGNHDPHASIALTIALHERYENEPRVTIDLDPSDFFYHRFGETLIGATHGHKMKPDKMAMNMAVTHREDWGATKYHWMLFGHIHHETAKEVGDVRVESFQTLAAKDAYASSHGYNAGQSLSSITLHLTEGEIGRHRINICNIIRRD